MCQIRSPLPAGLFRELHSLIGHLVYLISYVAGIGLVDGTIIVKKTVMSLVYGVLVNKGHTR